MHFYKCKNSVFCICFLIFFFLGTICGVLCFRCQMIRNGPWILAFSKELSSSVSPLFVKNAVILFRSLLLLLAMALLPWGYRLVFPLIALRGFLMSYYFSALWIGECNVLFMVLLETLLMPAYYMMCSWAYFRYRSWLL